MQIVIDIDDETYKDIKKGKIYSSFRDVPLESVNAIANGTPLQPHGRLIDASALKNRLEKHHDFFINAYDSFSNLPQNDKARVDEIINCISEIVNAPTILEANETELN